MTPEELIAEQDATITELRAELGTASPSPVDLEGRPELAALYEAVR